jgi:hypothetical protein
VILVIVEHADKGSDLFHIQDFEEATAGHNHCIAHFAHSWTPS